jgi:rhodanese-related sulfurtransferase
MTDIVNLTANDVHSGLAADKITLVDVREAHEFAARHIEGSVNVPLSRFDPASLPAVAGKPIVFMCAGGVRSVKAIDAANAAGLPVNQHLAGGIGAWVQAGLPTV